MPTFSIFISDGLDYFGGQNLVFFLASIGSRRQCISVTVFLDFVYENTETFEIDLGLHVSTSGVILYPDVSQVTILDTDGKSSTHDMHDT